MVPQNPSRKAWENHQWDYLTTTQTQNPAKRAPGQTSRPSFPNPEPGTWCEKARSPPKAGFQKSTDPANVPGPLPTSRASNRGAWRSRKPFFPSPSFHRPPRTGKASGPPGWLGRSKQTPGDLRGRGTAPPGQRVLRPCRGPTGPAVGPLAENLPAEPGKAQQAKRGQKRTVPDANH